MAKKRHLRKLFGTLPAQVTFVEMDFNYDSLQEKLFAAGFDRSLRTLFILEGVIYYLPETAVRDARVTGKQYRIGILGVGRRGADEATTEKNRADGLGGGRLPDR